MNNMKNTDELAVNLLMYLIRGSAFPAGWRGCMGSQPAGHRAGEYSGFSRRINSCASRSVVGPLWTHQDIVLITYGDTIQSPAQPPLQTLRAFLKRHLADAFSMVHLLPFYPWSSDGGFSVTDFRSVNPALGDWEDIAALEEDYDLVFDLVLNHCSRENLWFIDYIAGEEPACNYFIEVEPDVNLVHGHAAPQLTGAEWRAHPSRAAPCLDDVLQ